MADAARGSLPFRGIEMLIPNMHMMEEYLENDELDLVQSTEGLPSPIFEHPASMDTEENSWRNLNLEDQCTDVLGLLSRNQRQWSADVTGGIPALELYKKNALQEGIDYLDRTAPTALHILAKRPQDFQKVPSSTQEQMMRSLLDFREQNLLEMRKDRVESHPLFLELAIAYDNSDFIACVEHCMGDGYPDLLHLQDKEGMNCLHHVFKTKPSPTTTMAQAKVLQLIESLVSRARPETLATSDNAGNTPVHYAMDPIRCSRHADGYVDAIKRMVLLSDSSMRESNTLFNKKGESPLTYLRNRALENQAKPKAPQALQPTPKHHQPRASSPKVFGGPEPKTSKNPQLQSTSKGMVNVRTEWRGISAPEGESRLEPAKDVKRPKTPPGADLDVVFKPPSRTTTTVQPQNELLVAPLIRRPSSEAVVVQSDDASARDTGRYQRSKGGAIKMAAGRHPMQSARDLREFLTVHYIRTRSDMEARKLLFRGRVSEINKNLCFDARDQKEAHQMVELLGRLAESKFHDTLAYVNIPTVNHHSSQGLHAVSSDGRNKRLNARVGRTELEAVFNKLAEVKVKTILRLSVEDRQYPPHTDASIEKSICGKDSLSQDSGGTMRVGGSFHIETWDWRKPDLSTDVILFAAPNVEHINLYWSGSQAVLRGWDSDEGIPRLATRGKLKFVTIHATPGIETRDRVERLLQRFQAKIHEKTSDSVRVKTILQMEGWSVDTGHSDEPIGPNRDSMNTTDNQHDWVETMDKFRAALISLPDIKTDQVKRVKVALVDDGINLGNLHMYNGNVKVTGLSFFPREYGSENPWHCSNTGHGTILANMVVRVNPRVHLCVLRVHDVATRDGGRNIFARSAARAIKSAIEQDVDVICMSWTIKTRIERSTAQLRGDGREISTADKEKPELTDIQRLEKAIDAAKEAGILMFCSASDDIMASAMDTLPYRKQPDYIFRIGAAQSLGQQDPHSEDVKRIDYFFPGHQVAEARNPRSNQAVEYHDGSSIGTALAAGLASLIIHCARLAHYSYEKRKARGVSGRNPYEGLDRALREQASMKMALDNIKKNHSPGHEKFLPVWNVFRSRTEEMAKIPKAKEDDKWEAMERLMDQLRYGIEY